MRRSGVVSPISEVRRCARDVKEIEIEMEGRRQLKGRAIRDRRGFLSSGDPERVHPPLAVSDVNRRRAANQKIPHAAA